MFNQPEVIRALTSSYVPLRVNVDEDRALAQHYRVDRWPTDVIVTAQGQEIYRGTSPLDPNRYIATLDQIASHARLGMPFAGSPSTDIAMTSPSAMPTRESLSRASAFPVDAAAGSGGRYVPPTLPGSQPYGQSTASGNNVPNSPYGGARVPESPTGAARPVPQTTATAAPSYVTNQYAAESQVPSPGASTSQHPAEQRASFTTGYGSQIQPPAAPQRPEATAPANQPLESSNPYIAGLPSRGAATLPPGGPGLSGPPAGAMNSPAQSAHAEQVNSTRQIQPPQATPGGQPSVAMDGYCCVTLIEQEKWVKGDPRWGVVHRGRVYLFTGPAEQQRFLANFDKYAPALSGYDCVKYADQGTLVDGKRAHGVFYRGQIFLFADEAALQTFWSSPERFAPLVRAEQQRQAARPRDVRR